MQNGDRSDCPGQEKNEPGVIRSGDLVIETVKRKVSLAGRLISLTAKEFDLLYQFACHPGRVYTRTQLLDGVWGLGYEGYEHTVNSHINRLRAKIEDDPTRPHYVQTVWGVGYKFRDGDN
jgi:DNA-binding response OmpR family regulator